MTTTAGVHRLSWSRWLVALLLVVSAVFLWLQYDAGGVAPAGGSTVVDAATGPRTAAAAPTRAAEPERVHRQPADPRRLRIPSLGVDAPVVPVTTVGRTLVPPRDPMRLGWWADGARPGSARGSALLTGHTVHSGGGALTDLEDLRQGDRMSVRAGGEDLAYRVESVEILPKGALAQKAARIFDQDVPGRLVVITCERWNGVEYLSNVVVTASQVDPRPR